MRLENKVTIITGAGSGIGRESALLFAKEGAKVVVVDIDTKSGEQVTKSIKKAGGQAVFVQADVSDSTDVANMVAVAETTYTRVDVLFNNAGISHPDDSDAIQTDESVWDTTMNVNVKSVFLGCKHAIPVMQRNGGGVIINTASFVAMMGAATPQLAYTASKGAVVSMSRELAVIHAKENIRVCALCPGPLHTALLMKYLDTDEKKQRRLVHMPMGRFGEAHEIAKAALFLASDDASYITGAPFIVDGGISSAYVTAEGDGYDKQ